MESILEALVSPCPHVEVTDIGHGRHYIGTGFTYDDGDELRIILKRGDDGGWILSDEGHTLMWLSYGDLEMTPSLGSMMEWLLRQNRLEGARHPERGRERPPESCQIGENALGKSCQIGENALGKSCQIGECSIHI